MLGRWYTRPFISSPESDVSTQPGPSSAGNSESEPNITITTYFYCQGPEQDEDVMIGCDNPNCRIEWFHVRCLKIKVIPKGKCYCPTCRKLPECKGLSTLVQ